MKHRNKVDLSFRYVPSNRTNVAETFKRIKRELSEQKNNVTPIRKARKV